MDNMKKHYYKHWQEHEAGPVEGKEINTIVGKHTNPSDIVEHISLELKMPIISKYTHLYPFTLSIENR